MKLKKVFLTMGLVSFSAVHTAEFNQDYLPQQQEQFEQQPADQGSYWYDRFNSCQLPVLYYVPFYSVVTTPPTNSSSAPQVPLTSTQVTINCCSKNDCYGDESENCCNQLCTNVCGTITRVVGYLLGKNETEQKVQ